MFKRSAEDLVADRKSEAEDLVVVDSEYAVVSLGPSWGMLSTALAALSLPLRFWARNLPWHPTQHWQNPIEMLLGILTLTAAGAFFGWLGLRRGQSPGLAKIGLFLNATIAALIVLWAGTLFVYFRLLR